MMINHFPQVMLLSNLGSTLVEMSLLGTVISVLLGREVMQDLSVSHLMVQIEMGSQINLAYERNYL